MFANNSPRAEIKLIDFGLSTKFADREEALTDGVGTMYVCLMGLAYLRVENGIPVPSPFICDFLTSVDINSYTMAPEVLAGKYTQQADLWSVGVIAYMLMSSQMPFYGRKPSQIIEKIQKG